MIEGGAPGGSALQRAAQRRATAERLVAEASWLEALASDQLEIAARLEGLPPAYAVMHDLRMPGSKGNIDHLIIGPGGAFVIVSRRCSAAVTFRDGQLWVGDQSLSDVFTGARVESEVLTDALLTPVVPVVALHTTSLPAAAPRSLDGALVCTAELVVRVVTRASHTLLPPHKVGEVAERALPMLHSPGTVSRVDSSGGRVDVVLEPGLQPALPPATESAPTHPTKALISAASRGRLHERSGRARTLGFVVGALLVLCLAAVAVGTAFRFAARDDDSSASAVTPNSLSVTVASTGVAASAPPLVAFTPSCPGPGAGWYMQPVWPGELPGLVRYDVDLQAPDGSWTPLAPLDGAGMAWAQLAMQPAAAAHTVRFTAVMADGRRLVSESTVVTTPADSC